MSGGAPHSHAAADLVPSGPADADNEGDAGMSLLELLQPLAAHWKLLVLGPLAAGLAALGITFLIPPTFTASTTVIPPQQGQSSVALALAALGPLAGLAGGAGAGRNPGEQYLALLQSVNVADRIIEQFKLLDVYGEKYRVDARRELANNVRVSLGKRDGLITIEVDDKSPLRAADMANRYVDELRRVTAKLAVTEAQQRRVFFEQQLTQSRQRLVLAQQALQDSGFNAGALKAEPKAAAEAYARLKAEIASAEVRLQSVRTALTDAAPEVRQQLGTLAGLRDQLARVEQATAGSVGPDYIGKYRDFKYEEALFEVYSRQFELARIDESREGALIQIVDLATPPEKKSKPKRGQAAVATTLAAVVLLAALILARQSMRRRAGGGGASAAAEPSS